MIEDEESDIEEEGVDDGFDQAQEEEEEERRRVEEGEEDEEPGPSSSTEPSSSNRRKYVSHMEWLRFRLRRIWKSKVFW